MNLQLLYHALGQNLTKLQQRILISVIQIPRRTNEIMKRSKNKCKQYQDTTV